MIQLYAHWDFLKFLRSFEIIMHTSFKLFNQNCLCQLFQILNFPRIIPCIKSFVMYHLIHLENTRLYHLAVFSFICRRCSVHCLGFIFKYYIQFLQNPQAQPYFCYSNKNMWLIKYSLILISSLTGPQFMWRTSKQSVTLRDTVRECSRIF